MALPLIWGHLPRGDDPIVPGSSARQDDEQAATLLRLSQEIEASLSPALSQMATPADRLDLFRLDSMLRDVLNAFIIPIQVYLEHLASLSWDCQKSKSLSPHNTQQSAPWQEGLTCP